MVDQPAVDSRTGKRVGILGLLLSLLVLPLPYGPLISIGIGLTFGVTAHLLGAKTTGSFLVVFPLGLLLLAFLVVLVLHGGRLN